jgi:adenylate cyclase
MTAIGAPTGLLARLLPAPVDDRALPERVRQEIRAEQQRGDVLVGAVQAVVCAIFALLYLFARKTYPADAPFNPVPWALAAYGAFTALRLAAARRDRLPGWFQLLSIVVDMALLLGLIWSFHLQYRQVPAFYLKAPTVLYLFIFIALRALRFDARYVLVAGAVAAVGWLGLVAYAATNDPTGMPVTRDYVAYMTSPLILWGAEIDKIVSILLVTALLAVAITRAQRMLHRAVADGEAARDLKRFFAPDVAARITGADRQVRPGEGEIRDAATMFIDLRGFTSLSRQLDANGLVALLAEYQALIVPVIQRHGGSIDKFLGDGIMASFGATRPSAAYAADALRCVEDIVAVAHLWRETRLARGLPGAEIGVAVAGGPVLFGAVGDESRLEYTVIGDAVNLAAKLEKHTKVEGARALTTADTFERARAQGYQPRRRHDVRPFARVAGVDHPLTLVALA